MSDDPREHDRRIERLLADAEAATGPVAWPRVEALLAAIVDLYGRGLARVLEHAREGGNFEARIAGDELVASLLVLHGLHPEDVELRVARALERLAAELPEAAPLSLVGVEHGAAIVRAAETGVPPPAQVVARAVEHEAPELEGVRMVGAPSPRDPGLVPATRLVKRRSAATDGGTP